VAQGVGQGAPPTSVYGPEAVMSAGNVDEIVYQPIKADATRLAALLSGEIDFVLDPSPQDIPPPPDQGEQFLFQVTADFYLLGSN